MKPCTISCSPVALLFFMILLITQHVVDAQGCCFSLNYEIIPGGQYSVNVTATDSDVNDQQYKALIQFPSGYTVNPNPTSPFANLSCTQKAGTSFECETANYQLFFANFILNLPPVPPNTTPERPSAQVTVLGTACKQQDFCSTLVTPASSDKISLGFLGVWPKYVVIIVGVVLGLLLFAIFFYIWRQYNPSDVYRDRSEVTDILHDKNPSHGASSPAVLLEAATRGRSVKKPPPVAKKSDHPRDSKPENVMVEVYNEKLVAQKLGSGLSDSRFLPMTSVVVDMENDTVSEVEIEDEAASRGRSHDIKMLMVSADAGVARNASVKEEKERERREERERHRERERDRERESHRIAEERGRRDDKDRERHRDSKNLSRSATTAVAKTRENEKYDRESRSHRHSTYIPKERSRSRDAAVAKPRENEKHARERESRSHRHSTYIPKERSRSRDAAVAKTRENEKHDRERERESRSHRHSTYIPKERSRTRENEKHDRERESRFHRHSTYIPKERSGSHDAAVAQDERDGQRTSSRRSKPRDSTASSDDLPPEIPLSRPKATSGGDESTHSPSTRNKPRTEKDRDDLRRQAIRTSASELDIVAESGATPVSDHRKSVISKSSHSEKSKASPSRSSRSTTTVSLPSKSLSKRSKKQEAKRDGDDSDNESSSSENLPLGDRLPLAMIASTATSPTTTTSIKEVDKSSRKLIHLKSSSKSKPSILTTPKSVLKKQSPKSRDGQNIEDGDGNYYESILDDVLNAGDPDASELSTGSEEVPIGKWAQQTLHGSGEKRKSILGVAASSTSEDDEVPIGRLRGVSK